VIDYEPLRGEINYNLLPNATEYTFIEPHATITVTPTQKLIGLIGAELGYDGSGNGTAYFNVGICYRANGSTDPLTPIIFYSTSNEYGIKDFYWASVKDAILGEGSWDVGYCIMNYGASTLVNHLGGPSTSLSGWLMVVE
jgi:hypothetical protein